MLVYVFLYKCFYVLRVCMREVYGLCVCVCVPGHEVTCSVYVSAPDQIDCRLPPRGSGGISAISLGWGAVSGSWGGEGKMGGRGKQSKMMAV